MAAASGAVACRIHSPSKLPLNDELAVAIYLAFYNLQPYQFAQPCLLTL